ncbi:MAG: ABC transporter ATP-binding protein [bacterium]|nr:ABC transporter ATP-binding protein [bacterium]
MIELNNVTKLYKYRKTVHYVMKDVSLKFPSNKNIGILGKNGAGKSTLLRLIGGMEFPNFGKIHTKGKISWPVARSQGMQGSLSARDNIMFVCKIFGKDLKETTKILAYVEEFSEIGKHFNMPIKTYSSGMKARVNFGLSMAFDFDYYLVDECTSVGDKSFKDKARNAFELKRKTSSIIMVSHNMNEIKNSCDIVLMLSNGKITIYDDVERAIKLYKTL